jgi:peptidoglycan/xylan/chitin deacetylase (PgdA/CDA1 family)
MTKKAALSKVCLTFDVEFPDRPHGDITQIFTLLDMLDARRIKATFFIEGRYCSAFPDHAKEISRRKHLIGLHSYSHVSYQDLTSVGIRADLRKGRSVIAECSGMDPAPWFRLPYGSGARTQHIMDTVESEGFSHVDWNVDPRDWNHQVTIEFVKRGICDGIRAVESPAVVLLHSWPAATARAVQKTLDQLTEGVHFLRVDELTSETFDSLTRQPAWRPDSNLGKDLC